MKALVTTICKLVGRAAFLAAAVWILWNVLFPPWVGNSYNPAFDDPNVWRYAGTFGLDADADTAPLWSPPLPYSNLIGAVVRWPWQRPNSRHSVEISVDSLMYQISRGLVVLGFLAKLIGSGAAPPSDRRCAMVLWRWAWSVLIMGLLTVLLWLMFRFWGGPGGEMVRLLSFPTVLAAVGLWSLRSKMPTVAESTSLARAASAQDSPGHRRTRYRPLALVVGLLGGGLAGPMLAIGVMLMSPNPTRPSPEAAYGSAIGMVFLGLGGIVLGGLFGVAAGTWWTAIPESLSETQTPARVRFRHWYWKLAIAVTTMVVLSFSAIWGNVSWMETLLLASVLTFPWILSGTAFKPGDRAIKPRWLHAAALAGLTLASMWALPIDLYSRYVYKSLAIADFHLLPVTVLVQLGVLYLTTLVYLWCNARPTFPGEGRKVMRRIMAIAGLIAAMVLVGRVDSSRYMDGRNKGVTAGWPGQPELHRVAGSGGFAHGPDRGRCNGLKRGGPGSALRVWTTPLKLVTPADAS